MRDPVRSEKSRVLVAILHTVMDAEPVDAAVFEKYGVRLADLRTLRVLQDLGAVPISRFAEVVEIPRSSATVVVDRLEGHGLVERVLDKIDRRMIRIRVTSRGLMALRDCRLLSSSVIGRHLEALSPEQQRQLADLLELIIHADSTPTPLDMDSGTGGTGA